MYGFFMELHYFLTLPFNFTSTSVVLIFGFVLALTMLGKLPRYRHWFLQVGLQILSDITLDYFSSFRY